jgi:hypothetical protein
LSLLRVAGTTSPADNICCGVWVPACAGTTAVGGRQPPLTIILSIK